MQESCGNISQEPILPCKKILKIWRSGKLGIDIFPAWEYGNANNFKRPIARSEDRGAADKSSAFAPAQEAGARERGCRRSGNGSCAVCRWFVGEHPPDCHVCGALSRSASCLSPPKVMTGLPDCSTVAAVNASQSIYGFVFCLHRECAESVESRTPLFLKKSNSSQERKPPS